MSKLSNVAWWFVLYEIGRGWEALSRKRLANSSGKTSNAADDREER